VEAKIVTKFGWIGFKERRFWFFFAGFVASVGGVSGNNGA